MNEEGVLLQLLLSHYLSVCQELKPAAKLVQAEPKLRKEEEVSFGKYFDEIGPSIGKIAGSHFKTVFSVPWKNESGLLEKMEEYSLSLLLNKLENRPIHFTLYMDIGDARAQAKHCLKLLKLWQCESSSYMQRLDDREVMEGLEDLIVLVNKIGISLADALQFASENENVVLYFLRRKEEISSFVGKSFVKKVLEALPPKQSILDKFENRGFVDVCEEINALL